MDKVIKDGKVGVLFSPGFGAGWSTWNYEEGQAEFMCMGAPVVQAFIDGGPEKAVEVAEAAYPGKYVCCLGAGQLNLEWIDQGTKFRINEYDGFESIETLGSIDFMVA